MVDKGARMYSKNNVILVAALSLTAHDDWLVPDRNAPVIV